MTWESGPSGQNWPCGRQVFVHHECVGCMAVNRRQRMRSTSVADSVPSRPFRPFECRSMSVALESLMRQSLSPQPVRRQRSGVVSSSSSGWAQPSPSSFSTASPSSFSHPRATAGSAASAMASSCSRLSAAPALLVPVVGGACARAAALPGSAGHGPGPCALFGALLNGVAGMPSVAASILVIALTSGVNFFVLRSWAFAWRGRTAAATA